MPSWHPPVLVVVVADVGAFVEVIRAVNIQAIRVVQVAASISGGEEAVGSRGLVTHFTAVTGLVLPAAAAVGGGALTAPTAGATPAPRAVAATGGHGLEDTCSCELEGARQHSA